MFGRYTGDFHYSDERVELTIDRPGSAGRYLREADGTRIEKILPPGEATVIINPVEPVNLPEPLSQYLEIAFPTVVLPSRTEQRILLTFPLEIGAFLSVGSELHILDIFSYGTAKYSLYGPPSAGQITRWHRSPVYREVPVVDRFSHGVLDLTIRNGASETVEIGRTVLDSGSMHIFYENYVTMAALMEVYSPAIARTSVRETPPAAGFRQSIEIYAARRIPAIHGRGHLMEFGIA